MDIRVFLAVFGLVLRTQLFCQSKTALPTSYDTIYYSSEFNFSFTKKLKSDSVKTRLGCSKDFFYYFPSKDKKEVWIKEYYENGTRKSSGLLMLIGPFDKKLENVSFIGEVKNNEKGKPVGYKQTSVKQPSPTKFYYIEKSGNWEYYDTEGKLIKTENHTLPKDPKSLLKTRMKDFGKRCSEFKLKYPNIDYGGIFITYDDIK
jgi:hypothetical protein